MPTIERLREVLNYDPATGVLVWRKRMSQRVKAGHVAGSKMGKGYLSLKVDGRNYLAHRVAWALVAGQWPDGDIDHVNGIRDDNRIENLRLATRPQNSANTPARSNNKVGLKGVCFHRASGKYVAQIRGHEGKAWIGTFDCPAAASMAYQIKADELHGEFARVA